MNRVYKTFNLSLEQCSQILCEIKNKEGMTDAIMCGKGGSYCSSDQWCTHPSNVKYSYWTSKNYPENTTCNSDGK